MNRSDYFFWTVLAGVLALQWGILGLMIYLTFVVTWSVAWSVLPTLAVCLITARVVWKTIRKQREETK